MICNKNLNYHRKVCKFCTIYTILFAVAVLIIIGVSSAFIHFYWYSNSRYIETTTY